MVVNHIDGDKHNNRLENLEVITTRRNTQLAWETGLCEPSINHSYHSGCPIDIFDNVTLETEHFKSKSELIAKHTSLKRNYIVRMIKSEFSISTCTFKSKKLNDTWSLDCYWNGTLIRSFRSYEEAGRYFDRLPRTIKLKTDNPNFEHIIRYKFIFPDVSTIEKLPNVVELSRVHDQCNSGMEAQSTF